MADAIASIQAPDAAAIRRALIASIGGAQGLPATIYDPQFEQAVANLYATTNNSLANYSDQEQRIRSAYEQNRATDLTNQGYDQLSLDNRMGNSGLAWSSPRIDANSRLNENWLQTMNKLDQAQQNALGTINTNRLNTIGGYNNSLSGLESGYVNNIGNYLQNQATAQATADQTNASNAAQRALDAQTAQLANAQAQDANAQYSAIIKANPSLAAAAQRKLTAGGVPTSSSSSTATGGV